MESICSTKAVTENNNRCNHWNTEECGYYYVILCEHNRLRM